MKITDYDRENGCCKKCGMLMPYDEKLFALHTQEECFVIEMKNRKLVDDIKNYKKEDKLEILNKIQKELKAPKNQMNAFGNYRYRSCEDILEAVKPLLGEATLTLSDEIVLIGDRYYVKATATLTTGLKVIFCSAYARESLDKKGMDSAQITGAASSYARKYALNGLFCIDDNKDADTTNNGIPEPIKHEAKETTRPDGGKTITYSEKPCSEKQIKCIRAVSENKGMSIEELMEELGKDYGVTDVGELTMRQASEVIDRLQNKS